VNGFLSHSLPKLTLACQSWTYTQV